MLRIFCNSMARSPGVKLAWLKSRPVTQYIYLYRIYVLHSIPTFWKQGCSSLPVNSPWYPSCFHMISQCDIMWPNIILPFLQSNDTTQDIPWMYTNTHVDIDTCGISHFPVMHQKLLLILCNKKQILLCKMLRSVKFMVNVVRDDNLMSIQPHRHAPLLSLNSV